MLTAAAPAVFLAEVVVVGLLRLDPGADDEAEAEAEEEDEDDAACHCSE